MTDSPDAFSQLITRIQEGDEDALGELIRQYEPEVRRAARALLGPTLRPHLDSVDLSQSVHFTLVTGLREQKFEISSPEKLVALAATLVRRKVARHWRKLRRQERLEGEDFSTDDLLDRMASLARPPEDPSVHAEYREQLLKALNSMSEIERQLIELRLQGHNTAEAARRLGQDPDVLRVRLGRMRQRLRDSGFFTDWL